MKLYRNDEKNKNERTDNLFLRIKSLFSCKTKNKKPQGHASVSS